MALLALVRNFVPSHDIARSGGWDIADCVARSYDLEGMDVGTVGAGRIGQAVMRVRKLHCGVLYVFHASP
jgi:formate dehydrogenase